ncbi:MAG: glycosyltransferase [Candidatus Margulisiibacteriota bacterium]|nr:glycosyltransferase [Candidatus Margulisiibacteriota bacterium]
MKISIVIGTYNQKDTLEMVLRSFADQTIPPSDYEIVVIDSSSSDGTDQMMNHIKVPYSLKYLVKENKGKSSARNHGVKEARSDIILLTDADMIAANDLLENHLIVHQQKKNASVEGATYNLKKKVTVDELNPNHPDVEPYIKQHFRNGKKLKWSYFLSGNLSLKKDAFLRAGGFDEKFSIYGWEDIELGYRLKKMGVPLIYCAKAANYHYHFVSGEDMLKRKYRMGQSAAYFYRKHPNFTVKMFLGMNPIAMFIFNYLKKQPEKLKKITNQYILEEYYYRLGLTEELEKLKS